MKFKIPIYLWPVLLLLSPVIIPLLIIKNKKFNINKKKAVIENQKRIKEAKKILLPELEFTKLRVIIEEKVKEGFERDSGVSYLFNTDKGSLLYDVGFGNSSEKFESNIKTFGIDYGDIDSIVISHFHPDHCGGIKASKEKKVNISDDFKKAMKEKKVYIPESGHGEVSSKPMLLNAGVATTGSLARGLFFFEWLEEQALIFNLKGKGLVIITGCGHPTLEVILDMVRRISDINIYAIGGGIHFPIKEGRGNHLGIQFQRLIGTGKKPWENILDEDINSTIDTINKSGAKKVYISAHDSSDYSIDLLHKKLDAETIVLKSGGTYNL